MKDGPDISQIAALIGNPANANMLMALMPGPALTATELAQEAGLMLSTASGHLAGWRRPDWSRSRGRGGTAISASPIPTSWRRWKG